MLLGVDYLLVLGLLALTRTGEALYSQDSSSCSTTFQLFAAGQEHLSVASRLLFNSEAQNALPQPGDGVTLLLPEDEAFGTLVFNQTGSASDISFMGSPSLELAVSNMSAVKLASLLLYWTLPAALSQQDLQQLGNSATGLSLVTQSAAFDLSFAGNAFQTVATGSFQNATLARSYAVCGSWVHTTTSLLWPSPTPNVSLLPDPTPGGRLIPAENASAPAVPLGSEVFAPSTLAAATKSARNAQRRAELVPILAGVLGGMLIAALLLFLATVVAMRSKNKKQLERAKQDLEAQFRKTFVERGGSASARAKGSSDAVLAQMLKAQQETPKMTLDPSSDPNAASSSRGRRQHQRIREPAAESAAASKVSQAKWSQAGSSSLSSLASTVGPKSSLFPMNSAESLRSSLGQAWQDTSWQIDASEIEILKDESGKDWLLGQGGYGSVYKARMSGTTDVACKVMDHQSETELERFAQEIQILKDLRHVNIVQFLGVYFADERLVLVTEYLAGGNLQDALGRDMQRELSWYKRGSLLALDIVRGVLHMHSRRILHLDLKAANILLARDGSAKVADVGLSKVLSREATNVSTIGSFDYLAPEVLTGQQCSETADIWSLGCILWQICTGEAIRMRQLRPLRVPEECPEEVQAVIQQCRCADPSDRPSVRDVFDRLRQSMTDSG